MPRLSDGIYNSGEHHTLDELEAFTNKDPSPFTPVYIALEDAVEQIKELNSIIDELNGEVEDSADSVRRAYQDAHYARMAAQTASENAQRVKDEARSQVWRAQEEARRIKR